MESEETRDQTRHGDPDRGGYMGEPHRADVREISDSTAPQQTDPALADIDTENPNVNDTDRGDGRLVDPGTPKRGDA